MSADHVYALAIIPQLTAKILSLEDQLTEAKADRERMDWLDSRDCGFGHIGYGDYEHYSGGISGFNAREAIDAARKKEAAK